MCASSMNTQVEERRRRLCTIETRTAEIGTKTMLWYADTMLMLVLALIPLYQFDCFRG